MKIPYLRDFPKGEHRILFSDAETLNRLQTSAAATNRYLDIPETISLLNQERQNNRLYVSLVEPRATYYSDDKTLPALPASVLWRLSDGAHLEPGLSRNSGDCPGAAIGDVRPGCERQLFPAHYS